MVQSKQAFSLFFDQKNDFISVTPSWEAFQALRGGKMSQGYFYPNITLTTSSPLTVKEEDWKAMTLIYDINKA